MAAAKQALSMLRGSLTDRVAALSAVGVAIGSMHPDDAGFEEVERTLRAAIATLADEASPLLREAAWLLERDLRRR